MENLEHIHQGLKTLVAEIQAHPSGTEDMRRSYLELTLQTFNLYYIQCNTVNAALIISKKYFSVARDEVEVLSVFNKSVSERDFFYARRNGANRGLLLESWSTFEFCLTYLCDLLFTDDIKAELLERDLNDIKKILTDYELSEVHMQKISKMFYRDHLTHVPVTRKYNKLYSLYQQHYTGIGMRIAHFWTSLESIETLCIPTSYIMVRTRSIRF